MKKRANYIIGLCGIVMTLFVMVMCKAIIEEDISDKKVTINAPANASLEGYNQTFWWDKLDGAISYEVTIASPSFDSLQQLIVDTVTTSDKFIYTLAPGKYEWRIKAMNGSYSTGYSGSKFTILVSDLKLQYVILTTPRDLSYYNATSATGLTLNWNSLYGVAGYEIQVDNADVFNGTYFLHTNTPANYIPISPTTEATYYWRVRGYKDTDTSMWSQVSSFTYDKTPPAAVTLTAPANSTSTTVPATGTLQWTDADPNNTYVLYITYGTSAQQTISGITSTSYAYSGTTGQTVTWKVQAVDKANNTSAVTAPFSFKIQ